MKRFLVVGDLHIKRSDVDTAMPLFQRIVDMSRLCECSAVVLLGDIYHNHGITHSEEQEAVWSFFEYLKSDGRFPVINIEGNHDTPSDFNSSALTVHSKQVWNIRKPSPWNYFWGFMPYYKTSESFLQRLDGLLRGNPQLKYVFCHQEFQGCQYENGFYAPNGVDPVEIEKRGIKIISGHIHKQQEFGPIWYPGAPRWNSKSDANQDRGIWLVDFEEDGTFIKRTFYNSADICPAYRSVVVNNSSDMPSDLKESDKIFVEYLGDDKEDIQVIQSKYKNISIRFPKKTVQIDTNVSEIKGIDQSIVDYVNNQDMAVDRMLLLETIKNRRQNAI